MAVNDSRSGSPDPVHLDQRHAISMSCVGRGLNSSTRFSTSGASADLPSARAALLNWWQQRLGTVEPPVLDNGSGLSRSERISAQALARLLQAAHASTLMPELMASLPIYGVDGTLRRVPQAVGGGAHLKTGSLADVTALGGYVHAASGKRYVLVVIVNHANARAARTALQTLVQAAIAL